MKKQRAWMLLLALASITLLVLFAREKADAKDGSKPLCCLFVKGEVPSWLRATFVEVKPRGFKLLGRIEKIGHNDMFIRILATINKTEVERKDSEILQLSFPEGSVNIKEIRLNDYILLIPWQFYNVYFQSEMYDFVKIPKEFIE